MNDGHVNYHGYVKYHGHVNLATTMPIKLIDDPTNIHHTSVVGG
jgi:hypothetical protein